MRNLVMAATSLLLVTACNFHASGNLAGFSSSSSMGNGSSNNGSTPATPTYGSNGAVDGTTPVGGTPTKAPVIKSPLPGGTILIGRPTTIQVDTTDHVTCVLVRKGEEVASVGSQSDKPCEFSGLSLDWVGEAELVVRGGHVSKRTGTGNPANETREKVMLAWAQPQPTGPTPQWNGHYKYGEFDDDGGWFFSDDLTLKDGILSMKVKAKDDQAADPEKAIFAFAPVQVKVDSDGIIAPQQVALTVTKKPGGASASATGYLSAVKQVWVTGGFALVEGTQHALALYFQAPSAKVAGQADNVLWSNTYGMLRDDVDVAAMNARREAAIASSRSSGSSGGSSHGGRSSGGGDGGACKKACFHAEATCTGKRGDCMKTRQQCVSSCR